MATLYKIKIDYKIIKIIIKERKKMTDEFIRKQKAFHTNPGINPDNGKRLMHGKGPYLKFVELYGIPPDKTQYKTQIVELIFPLLDLPSEIVEEIVKYLKGETLANMLVTNKKFYTMKLKFKEIIFKNALQRELNHAKRKYKPYYQRAVIDIEVGDRINDSFFNYKVIQMKARTGKLIHVDMLGNKLSDGEYELNLINEGKRRYFWYINTVDKHEREARFGILRYDFGPRINSVDSKYIKYKTVPDYDDHEDVQPEINMLVLIKKYVEGGRYPFILEYVVNTLSAGNMTLKYLDGCTEKGNPVQILEAILIDEEWFIINENTHKILRIGSGVGDFDCDCGCCG